MCPSKVTQMWVSWDQSRIKVFGGPGQKNFGAPSPHVTRHWYSFTALEFEVVVTLKANKKLQLKVEV